MAEKTEKSVVPGKSFMTEGPTLHYTHSNVRMYWMLGMAVYLLGCLFWSKILTGRVFWSGWVDLVEPFLPVNWYLGAHVVRPLSIFQYPWHILVLGYLMGIMAVTPALVSQLLSFRHSLPFILIVAFVAKLGFFAFFVLVSCAAVACRPLRFRSRFVAVVLCISPQLLYWSIFGGVENPDPIRWGLSYTPWIWAWLSGLIMAGGALAIGHLTRYRPGLIWIITAANLLIAIVLFLTKVSYAELDYQLYVAGNNPEEIVQFHDHNMSEVIDSAINDPATRSYLSGPFYPTEPILLRETVKKEIQNQLGIDRWPSWFHVPEELCYQPVRRNLTSRYDLFIDERPASSRTPIALYYKAILNEFAPDIRRLGQSEILHFASDYPHHENLPIWYKLYREFPDSPESIEARWRLAIHVAGQSEFEKANELCDVALLMIEKQLKQTAESKTTEGKFLSEFVPPAQTVMTTRKVNELKRKINELKLLISSQNYTDLPRSKKKLANLVILNPYGRDYADILDGMLAETKEKDPLYDNVMLLEAMLINDPQQQAQQLTSISEKYPGTDGGIRSMYELALLKKNLWKDEPAEGNLKKKYLIEARTLLEGFISKYPSSIYTEEAGEKLKNLPSPE